MPRFRVVKGNRQFGISKGQVLTGEVTPLGPEYSHQARLRLQVAGRPFSLYVRFPRWVDRPEFNANNGDPTKVVRLSKVS